METEKMNLDPHQIKSDFPLLKRKINGHSLVYLDSAATSQKPRQVIDAIVDYYQNHNANVARGVHTLSEESTGIYEQSRAEIARFIKAPPEEIIFVRNATEALNLVAFSWGIEKLKKGDEIVTSISEHHSNLLPWRMVSEKTGAKFKYLDVDDEGKLIISQSQLKSSGYSVDETMRRATSLDQIQNPGKQSLKPERDPKKALNNRQSPGRAFSETAIRATNNVINKNTKLVALSIKSNMTGALQPIKGIVRLVRKISPGAIIVLDGSHSVPNLPTDVTKLGADFLAFSGHKMLGPMGIGVLWGKKKHLQAMPPFLRGGDMISHVTLNHQKWNTVPHKFEAGTPNVAGAVGLAAAVKYLENIGMENIHRHEIELTEYALEKLSRKAGSRSVGKIELIGPKDPKQRSGIVTFNLGGIHAHDVAQILDSEGVAVRSGQHCTGPLMDRLGIPASVRASFYLYNTKTDIDKLVKALKKIPEVFKL